MRGTSRHVAAIAIAYASGCGTGDTRVDPGDLELRDLLGVSPEVAGQWDAEQRASARRVLTAALDGSDGAPIAIEIGALSPGTLDERVTRSLAELDHRRFADGESALGVVRIDVAAGQLVRRAAPRVEEAAAGDAAPAVSLDVAPAWGTLSPRATGVLAALASDGGHEDGVIAVAPSARLPVIASYVAATPPRLLVNPVIVAALDPAFVDTSGTAARAPSASGHDVPAVAERTHAANGNPYSFYGSIAECAYAQRLRCESCLASSNCEPITTASSGNDECTTLAGNDGRGYFLICINLALAIRSVERCAADSVAGCPQDGEAASDLGRLEANATFLDDATCAMGLDACLAEIYGPSDNPFPGLVDGGVTPPPVPPRETEVSCGDSCSGGNSNCDASPSCSCDGPSCNNSFSCDSTCSSSNNQSGCGDNCDSCSSDGGGGGGGGGACSSDSGGSSGGGSCGGGGDCGGGDCGGGDCGGGDCGGGGGCSGGGGGGCQVAKKNPSPLFALALSLCWGLLPVPVAAMIRRRSRRARTSHEPRTDASGEEETR